MKHMTKTDAVHILAGTLTLIATIGTFFHSNWWLLLSGFVGLNLFQFGFTKFCPAITIMQKLKLFKD